MNKLVPRPRLFSSTFAFTLLTSILLARQEQNYAIIKPGDSPAEIIRKAANLAPSARQFEWQRLEFIAFAHFGMNTFTDREWGDGTESPTLFNPTDFDARQWVKVIKDAGMKTLILTAKHHDGFCLWPSKYTEHSVKNSPWKNGTGDVVREVAAACKEFGIKFGVYLSPWDRHEKSYGDSPLYNEHFCNQLRELLTNYGEISEVWFDGANAEGPNGKRQVYDWQSYYRVIRELQPGAVIAIMGPDVRWVGTESGYGRETEWSVIPDVTKNLDSIAATNQRFPIDPAFIPGDLTSGDLGSRDKIRHASALMWYPSETDVSIRPGWFYHTGRDNEVKSPEKLVDIYFNSAGRNSVLLLNIPPDKRGQISESDMKSLMGMRKRLNETFSKNLVSGARVVASSESPGHTASSMLSSRQDFRPDSSKIRPGRDQGVSGGNSRHRLAEDEYWTTNDGVDSATVEFQLSKEETFDVAMLQENIAVGQRVEAFRLESWDGNSWKEFARGTTIGYKRLLRFPVVTSARVRLVIEHSRTSPTLSRFGLFKLVNW